MAHKTPLSGGGGAVLGGAAADRPRGFDLLRLPGVRRLLRWRYARFAFQLPLLVLAALAIFDGLTGSQAAGRNVATAGVWLHYRGLVVIALALFGNAFCAACPLMLTRGLSRRLERLLPGKLRWPRALRSKAVVIVLTLAFLWSYEVFGLWASPWLTAWLAVGYFVAALAFDTLFPAGTFCRYVCPLGNFNFVLSSVSPTQITAVDAEVCRSCRDKPCLYGRGAASTAARPAAPGSASFPGCESKLLVPAVTSNMDCTYCFNCVRACPFDNVALRLRTPDRELTRRPWAGRRGVLLLGVLLAAWAVVNAFAMVGPFQNVAHRLARLLGTDSRAAIVLATYLLASAAALGATGLAAVAADLAGGARIRPGRAFRRWGPVLVAVGFGSWAAHYLFHFLTGAAAAPAVLEHFFSYRGAPLHPDWSLARMIPMAWLFPVQAVTMGIYAALAMAVAVRIGLRDFGRRGALAMWPMALFALALAALQLTVLSMPMEMRGMPMPPAG